MPPAPSSKLQIEVIDGVTVVLINEPVIVDDATLNAVRDELYKMVETTKPKQLVLNLSKVRKFSTEFLSNLVGLNSRVKKVGGELKISNMAPDLLVAVEIIRLPRIIDFFDEEQEAIDSF
jgi:anti-anti-sigma factor